MYTDGGVSVGEAVWADAHGNEGKKGSMRVFFHTKQVKHNFRSEQEKRPIYVEKIFITQLVPGDNRLVIDRPMREMDKEEFPREWAAWENKKANLVIGTPLDAWPIISDTQKAEFRALNIFTIDQFASLPDSAAEKIMSFNDLREKARAFLNAGKDSELLAKVRAEADARAKAQDAEMQALRAQLDALTKGSGAAKVQKKAKRKLSPEHLAALQAGRERAKKAA